MTQAWLREWARGRPDLREWAAKHPRELAVLIGYWESSDPAERELAATLIGVDRARTDLSWDFVTLVLGHLKQAEKELGAKRDAYISNLEGQARANLPPNASTTAVANEMGRLDPRYEHRTESLRITLQERKATDAKRARENGYLTWGEFE